MPKIQDKNRECFFFFNNKPLVFLIASRFGIFSSIGATPRQIRTCLLQEAMVLSILPMLIGSMSGILISYGVIKTVNYFASDVSGRHEAVFQYHPSIFAATVFISFLTVIFSAWIPARNVNSVSFKVIMISHIS